MTLLLSRPRLTSLPRGLSVWEISTGADPKKKADDDYAKRTAGPPNTARGTVSPSDTTFVFVIPRRWSAKKKCATARRKEQVWRDVRVLDADDLEAWLQEAPATHVWFSRILGVMPAGVSWLPQTSAALDARLVYDAEETEHAMV